MSDKINLIETISKQDQFSTFSRLMASSGANDLINSGQFTVFVPTNDAFAKVPEAKIDELVDETGQARLKALLSYHILPGKVMAASLVSAPTRKSFTGEELMFTDMSGLKVNNASIQARNLEATNGVVHALDTVLFPSAAPKIVQVSPTRPPRAEAPSPEDSSSAAKGRGSSIL